MVKPGDGEHADQVEGDTHHHRRGADTGKKRSETRQVQHDVRRHTWPAEIFAGHILLAVGLRIEPTHQVGGYKTTGIEIG